MIRKQTKAPASKRKSAAGSIVHDTFKVRRAYAEAPERVFAAFSDPRLKRRWFAEDDDCEVEEFTLDFRVGGRETLRFRYGRGAPMRNDTIFLDIVPLERIVFAYTMTSRDRCASASLGTIELRATTQDTVVEYTEQVAFFDAADGPRARRQGWRSLLERLAAELRPSD